MKKLPRATNFLQTWLETDLWSDKYKLKTGGKNATALSKQRKINNIQWCNQRLATDSTIYVHLSFHEFLPSCSHITSTNASLLRRQWHFQGWFMHSTLKSKFPGSQQRPEVSSRFSPLEVTFDNPWGLTPQRKYSVQAAIHCPAAAVKNSWDLQLSVLVSHFPVSVLHSPLLAEK